MPIERITVFCFAASYIVALAFELVHQARPRRVWRTAALGMGAAGLLAHTLFLAVQRLPLSSRQGSLLFLAWIVAVFYLYGTLHHRRIAWGLFVLPLVVGLVALAELFPDSPGGEESFWLFRLLGPQGERFWGSLHGALLLLAAVGVCVGFLASVMYLVQARRLRTKTLPGQGLRMLSLERLEEMNRRSIVLAFPLLTAGVLVGLVLMLQGEQVPGSWTDPRVLSACALWGVFALLLYLRYARHVRGRRVAILTIAAFVLLLVTLAVPHTLSGGGRP